MELEKSVWCILSIAKIQTEKMQKNLVKQNEQRYNEIKLAKTINKKFSM